MPLTVRSATPADVPVIVEYNRRLARETEHKTLDPATVSAGVAAAIADPATKGPYYLACDGADVVGQLQVTFEWSDWRNGWFWWIQSVYVRAGNTDRAVRKGSELSIRARCHLPPDGASRHSSPTQTRHAVAPCARLEAAAGTFWATIKTAASDGAFMTVAATIRAPIAALE